MFCTIKSTGFITKPRSAPPQMIPYTLFSQLVLNIVSRMLKDAPLVILGSSRREGHTQRAISTALPHLLSSSLIDLNDMQISYFDYTHQNIDDDFLPIAQKITEHSRLILATPVYWYTMSAILKTFLDRWSDLLDIKKDIGRAFRGKSLSVIASYYVSLPKGFEAPFSQTAEYMGMDYRGCYFFNANDSEAHIKRENEEAAKRFRQRLGIG